MTRRELKYQLWSNGISNTELAEQYGCSKQFVCDWFQEKATSKGLEKFILNLLKTVQV